MIGAGSPSAPAALHRPGAILAAIALALAAVAVARPAAADQAEDNKRKACVELEKKAVELIEGWPRVVEEISNDPYDDKLRRLRDRYDYIHQRLEGVRDDARYWGCNGLPEAIESAFRQWERP